MKYTIDYCNGIEDVVKCDDIFDAKSMADDGAAYTQCDIVVTGADGETVTRKWYGTVYNGGNNGDEWCENPICFGSFGYYGDWSDDIERR